MAKMSSTAISKPKPNPYKVGGPTKTVVPPTRGPVSSTAINHPKATAKLRKK